MGRNMIAAAAALACALALAAGLTAEQPKNVTKEQVKEMMTKLHKGEKSPLARTTAELKKDSPDWDVLGKDAKAFAEMGKLLGFRASYQDYSKYVAASDALGKAVGAKDAKAGTEAIVALNKSCSSCHYRKRD